MKLHQINEIIKNQAIKKQSLYRIENGVGCYIVKGVEFTEEEMDQLFPTPLVQIKPNPDKTNNWMADEKSY